MTTRIVLLVVIVAILAGGTWAIVSVRNQPPEVPFAKVVREEIVSAVPTLSLIHISEPTRPY